MGISDLVLACFLTLSLCFLGSALGTQLAATPANCVLVVPDEFMLAASPPQTDFPALAPIIKDSAAVTACTPDNSAAPPTGCTLGWTFLDGTPVPSDIGTPTSTWRMAMANQPLVVARPTGAGTPPMVQFETGTQNFFEGLTAYYECCLTDPGTCVEFTGAAASTGKSSKGKSDSRFRDRN